LDLNQGTLIILVKMGIESAVALIAVQNVHVVSLIQMILSGGPYGLLSPAS
jgi:hypothetical protein